MPSNGIGRTFLDRGDEKIDSGGPELPLTARWHYKEHFFIYVLLHLSRFIRKKGWFYNPNSNIT